MNMHWLPEELFLPRFKAVDLLARPSWRTILALVAMKHGVMQRDILGSCRFKEIVAARHEAIALTFRLTKASKSQVGRHFHRNHKTIWHALNKHDANTKHADLTADLNHG